MSRTETSVPIRCSAEIEVLGAADLVAAGWEQRTVGDPARIAELEALYRELGHETITAGLDPAGFGRACTDCAVVACPSYRALFIRRTGG
ncbi:MAG: hypothetical protein ACE5GB_00370 [Acidimicrobiales bacterium]